MMVVAIPAIIGIQVIILILLSLDQREGTEFYHFYKE